MMGGFIGDALTRLCGLHGRVFTAEISVYGGIPIAFFTFYNAPPAGADGAFWYFLCFTIALGLVATWTPTGSNSPILYELASKRERALVLAWQTSLEGAIGAMGPFIFTFLMSNVFGVQPFCLVEGSEDAEGCEDVGKNAGRALFWCAFIPWLVCGSFYSSLHYFYPRDLARAREERNTRSRLSLNLQMSNPALLQ